MSTPKQQKKKESAQGAVHDSELRPKKWDEYIGQEHIKKNLNILLGAAKERDHTPEHLLFYGPPGLGKTTLAHLISHHTNSQIKMVSLTQI